MRVEEARRIARIARELFAGRAGTILNIGSSTKHFREVAQPHIASELLNPLTIDGFRIVHCDLKSEDGVDYVGDLLNPTFRHQIAALKADLLLCCNVLEHLTDPATFAAVCADIVREGGYIVVSVPYSYPYHADPIDNGLRPDPNELAAMFPNLEVVSKEIVVSKSYFQDSATTSGGMLSLLHNLIKTLLPLRRLSGWKARAHRFLWLWRPYKVSIVVLSKPAASLSS